MKKFIYSIFVITALVGGLCSCNSSFLDTKPTDAVPAADAMTTIEDAAVAANGVYTPLKYYTMYSSYFAVFGDVRADSMYPAKREQGYKVIYQLDFDKVQNTYFGSFWKGYYETINYCNTFLANIAPLQDKYKQDEESTAKINNLIGEVLAVRALCYFDLARFYGYPYLKDKGASLGAVIVTEPILPADAKQLSRSTVAATYDQVLADMNKACSLLSKEKKTGHFNYWSATGMLAKIHLYMGNYSDALKECETIINGVGTAHSYELVSRQNYIEYWGHEGQPETLLEFVVSLKGDLDEDGGFYTLYQDMHFSTDNADNDGHCVVPTKKLVESYSETDIRSTMCQEYIVKGEVEEIWLNKFPGNKDRNFTFRRNNAMVLRMSDVYLMAAEAALQTGKGSKASDYVFEVASRRDTKAEEIGEDITLDDILLERFKEFPAEGQRFFDVLRNGKAIHHDYNYDSQDYIARDKAGYVYDVDWDNTKIVLPIAQNEMAIHPNLQQNPGY